MDFTLSTTPLPHVKENYDRIASHHFLGPHFLLPPNPPVTLTTQSPVPTTSMAAAASGSATGGGARLVDRCIDAAARGPATVEAWRRQRRSLERLPAPLADALFRRLAARRLLFPSLLE